MTINHPHGNIKISFIKGVASLLSNTIFYILKFFLDINSKSNEIIISRATYAPWKVEKDFADLYPKLMFLTLLDERRLFTLFSIVQQTNHMNGDILEIGCMRGGAGILMSKVKSKGRAYLIDTFDGFHEEEKYHKKNIFIFKDINKLKKNIKDFKLKKTYVLKQVFPNKKKLKNINKLKVCHIDVNTYQSTKNSYNYIKKKIVKGGFIVFDDYGIFGVEQVTKFVNTIKIKDKKLFHFINNYMGQCILIKK